MKINIKILLLIFFSIQALHTNSQTLQELVVPQYAIGKDASTQHSLRLPYNIRLQIIGLIPYKQYIVEIGLDTLNTGGFVAIGNVWNGSVFNGQRVDTTLTVTDSSGSVTFWAALQPTGNSRFEPFGTATAPGIHGFCYLKVRYRTSDSINFLEPLISTNYIQFLDCSQAGRTTSTNDDGAFLRTDIGSQFTGKYILTYDNTSGTGRPLACYRIENNSYDEKWYLQYGLPQVFRGPDTNSNGIYELVTPSNDSNGVQRIEIQNSDGSIEQAFTSPNGIWGGVNTVNPPRYTVLSPVTVIKNINSELPVTFQLYQNYPNPFNPVTKIKFEIADRFPITRPGGGNGNVVLKVYDILGKEIMTLVNEKLQTGFYEVTFDGSNLSSGVYYYKLFVRDFSEVRKMILIK